MMKLSRCLMCSGLELCLWLDTHEIPYETYHNLTDVQREVLRNCVCTPTHAVSDRQRANLYNVLCSQDIAGRNSGGISDCMTDEERRDFFSPVPYDKNGSLADWGCER